MKRKSKHLVSKLEAVKSFCGFARGLSSPKYPIEITLEISNTCNLRCAMCGTFSALLPSRQGHIRSEDRGFMNLVALSSTMGEALRHALVVNVFGFGEPTLHPQFAEVIDLLSEAEVLVEFFTNGMHLDQKLIELLIRRGVHRITVSISGATKSDYENVYLGGSFERVLAGLKALQDQRRAAGASFPKVEVYSLAFRHHVAQLDRFVALMAEHGVSAIAVAPLLAHPELISTLAGHALTAGSLAGDPTVAEALRMARECGVSLDIHPDLMAPATTAAATLPLIPIADFPKLIRPSELATAAVRSPVTPVLELRRKGNNEITEALEPRPLREMVPCADDFVCLEPFKSFYVRRNKVAKVCCYSDNAAVGLGDLTKNTALEIWRGAGFDSFRDCVLNLQYPSRACAHCLRHGQAPRAHGIQRRAREYADWHEQQFGGTPTLERLQRMAVALSGIPDGVAVLAHSRPPPLAALETASCTSDACTPRDFVFSGHVELLSADWISGWAADQMDPLSPAEIALHVNGRSVATTRCVGSRADAMSAGFPGARSFFLDPEPHLRLGPNTVEVRFARTGQLLSNGSKRVWSSGLNAILRGCLPRRRS